MRECLNHYISSTSPHRLQKLGCAVCARRLFRDNYSSRRSSALQINTCLSLLISSSGHGASQRPVTSARRLAPTWHNGIHMPRLLCISLSKLPTPAVTCQWHRDWGYPSGVIIIHNSSLPWYSRAPTVLAKSNAKW